MRLTIHPAMLYHLPPPHFTKLLLLFSSGQLTYLDLSLQRNCFCDWESVKAQKLIKLMTTEACKNISFLILPFEKHRGMSEIIPELLRRCPKLEYLVTYNCFDLGVLKNCHNLRSVRLNGLDGKPLLPFPWQIFNYF
ncbi:hypothetical protein CDAR_98371 [Caerostris darwini]|uniref:Uncharacterized protein n=1 Tax=Caerostris darwini TaxID=1538125 RepID=A0AAV4UFV0_9ARAC|nr:hypothetical protein CDAR_98371 [Caerostris darwini]